jgi:hypothetical protein
MKSKPFDSITDLSPIPFSDDICYAAKSLKEKGLNWQPHVGCFVWDENGNISVPSPFPNRIYFILNLGHFLKILESIKNIQDKLVWIPTFHQAQQICQQLDISPEHVKGIVGDQKVSEDMFIELYKIIEKHL